MLVNNNSNSLHDEKIPINLSLEKFILILHNKFNPLHAERGLVILNHRHEYRYHFFHFMGNRQFRLLLFYK